MARAGVAYVLASVGALAGMAWRMGWISEDLMEGAALVLALLMVPVVMIGAIIVFAWGVIKAARFVFGSAQAAPSTFTPGGSP